MMLYTKEAFLTTISSGIPCFNDLETPKRERNKNFINTIRLYRDRYDMNG
jgi:hypothetical protein